MITVNVTRSTPSFLKPAELKKGIALGLTKTAQAGQAAIQASLKKTFTIRGTWWKKSNKYGIKVKPAEKSDTPISSEVGTDADWLRLHEGGGTKKRLVVSRNTVTNRSESFKRVLGNQKFLAIPTTNVKRTKRQIIRRNEKPANLKRAFAVETSSGQKIIFARKGRSKKSKAIAMYLLKPTADIDNASTVIQPTLEIVRRKLGINFQAAMLRVTRPKPAK
jgi:hypothetical protein